MTAGYGWGMLAIGFAAILIGGLIAFFIINKVQIHGVWCLGKKPL